MLAGVFSSNLESRGFRFGGAGEVVENLTDAGGCYHFSCVVDKNF